MSQDTWKCPECGAENTGKFCYGCGLPQTAAEAYVNRPEPPRQPAAPETPVHTEPIPAAFRPQSSQTIPTLAEVKAREVPHGPLIACAMSGWSNGMMMNSHEEHETKLALAEDGSCTLTVREESWTVGKSVSVYRADAAVLEEIAAIAEQENLPAWEDLREDPEKRVQVMDWSGGSSVALTYDNRPVGGRPETRYSIGWGAAREQGGGEVLDRVAALLKACIVPENLVSEEKTAMPVRPAFPFGMGMMMKPEPEPAPPAPASPRPVPENAWVCPACGYVVESAGRFCPNCASLRPEK